MNNATRFINFLKISEESDVADAITLFDPDIRLNQEETIFILSFTDGSSIISSYKNSNAIKTPIIFTGEDDFIKWFLTSSESPLCAKTNSNTQKQDQ